MSAGATVPGASYVESETRMVDLLRCPPNVTQDPDLWRIYTNLLTVFPRAKGNSSNCLLEK